MTSKDTRARECPLDISTAKHLRILTDESIYHRYDDDDDFIRDLKSGVLDEYLRAE